MSTVEAAKSADATVTVDFWVFENLDLDPVTLPVSAASSVSALRNHVVEPGNYVSFTRCWGWRDLNGVVWLKPDNTPLTATEWKQPLSAFLRKPSAAPDAPPTNTVTFILKPPQSAPIAAGPGVPGAVAGTGLQHLERAFSTASCTLRDNALESLKLKLVTKPPPDGVVNRTFSPYAWPTETVTVRDMATVLKWKNEERETMSVCSHLNSLIDADGLNMALQDVRKRYFNVKFQHATSYYTCQGDLDLGLFQIPAPDPPVLAGLIGGIQLETPEKMAGYQPSDFSVAPLEPRKAVEEPLYQATLEAIGVTLRTQRQGGAILVSDFVTPGRVLVNKGDSVIEYRMYDETGKWLIPMDAHTAWNVWLHLMLESARIEREQTATLVAGPNHLLEAFKAYRDNMPDAASESSEDLGDVFHDESTGEPAPKRGRTREISEATTASNNVSCQELEQHFASQLLKQAMRSLIR